MYHEGDLVVYGIHGVCKVSEHEKQIIDRKMVTFLVLEPLGHEGARYLIPVDNETAMKKLRPLLTPDQLNELIHSEAVQTASWNLDENKRKQAYREMIGTVDRTCLIRTLHMLYRYKREQELKGKRLHQVDENFLHDGERLVSEEISIIMDLPLEQAKTYLRRELQSE